MSSGDVGGDMEKPKCCSDDDMCKCLDSAFGKLEKGLDDIAKAIGNKVEKSCSESELCIDEIERALKARWEKPLKTCDECQSMLFNGMAGTIEYALGCANLECGRVERECTMADPSTWGKPCSGCGQEPCCCEGGICLPCPEEDKKKKRYRGWCNPANGVAAVTREDQGPPGPNFIPISLNDSEQVALAQAQEVCKPPEQRAQSPSLPQLSQPSWYSNSCDLLSYVNGSMLSNIAANQAELSNLGGASQIAEAFGKIGIDGINFNNAGAIASGVLSVMLNMPPYMAKALIDNSAELLGCNNEQFVKAAQSLASFGYVNKVSGFDFTPFLTQYYYALNAACRQKYLDPDKAIAAFLGNAIDYDHLDTQWAVEGYCPDALQWYLKAARAKPLPFELGTMRLRGIVTPSQYHESMRELGYLEPNVRENLYKLRQQLPTLSDIIRMMIRDADDNQLAAQIGLDSQFDQKYGAQLRDWADQQGVPEQVARYAWRAHWTIPSPTQLFEFWRRLRKNPQFGGEAKLWKDIESALVQQDILPFWHEHYKAINYLPLGRVDVRRMFNNGSIKEDDLVGLYNQLGYSDENAEKLKKFAIQLRNHAIATARPVKLWNNLTIKRDEAERRLKDEGYPEELVTKALNDAEHNFISSPFALAYVRGDLSKLSFVNQLQDLGVRAETAEKIAGELAFKITKPGELANYSAGLVPRGVAEARMVADGMNADIVRVQLDDIDRLIDVQNAVACQRAIKRRFLTGDLDKQQASNELMAKGIVLERANKLLNGWECEKSSRGKPVAAAKLCHWLGLGIVTPADFLDRMKRVGYTADDAGRILNDCLVSNNMKLLAQAKKDAKEQAAASDRSRRAQEKAAKQLEAEAAKLQRARNQRAATVQRRQKQLLSAAQKIFEKGQWQLADALAFATETNKSIQSEFALTQDQALQVLILSAEEWDGIEIGQLASTIETNAFFAQQASLTPPVDPLSGSIILNGETQPS